MSDSSRPYSTRHLENSSLLGANMLRNQSGLPIIGADGLIRWTPPSTDWRTRQSVSSASSTNSLAHGDADQASDFSHTDFLQRNISHENLKSELGNQMTGAKGFEDRQRTQRSQAPSRQHRDSNIDRQSSHEDSGQSEKQRLQDRTGKGGEEKDPNLVGWDGPDDPECPMNWSRTRKWSIAVCMGLMTFVVTFASSVFSSATMVTSEQFGVGTQVMVLAVSLFVLGFAFGPIIWGPLSELYGRKTPLFIGYAIFAIFQIPVAVAQNLETIFVCRFFGGLFASAPLAIVGGALADFFDPINRGVAVCLFGASAFIGPAVGPIIGGFITMSYLGWRWTQWITLIMATLFGTIGFLVIPETFTPVLLRRRACARRIATKNWALHAPSEEKQVNPRDIVERYLLRPFKMLALEPILVLVTLYISLIYGIIYGFFFSFPVTFQMERGWNLGVGSLPFLAVLVGVIIGGLIITWITKTRTKRVMERTGHLVPEERLIAMIIGGALLPAGLFWFAWTSDPNITPWPQIIAIIPIGMGLMMIFLQGLNYIIDVYKMNANSAIAANTFFRSLFGAAFPLFSMPMFTGLGVPWAMSLLGFLTVALFPVPIVYFIYGARIRKWSRYTPE